MPATPTVKLLFDEPAAAEDDDLGASWRSGASRDKPNGKPAHSPRKQVSPAKKCLHALLYTLLALAVFAVGVGVGFCFLYNLFSECEDESPCGISLDWVPFLDNFSTDEAPSNAKVVALEEEVFEQCGQIYPWKRVRLPKDISPITYKLRIQPELRTRVLTGNVLIELQVEEATRHIVLHAQSLNITSFTLRIGSQLVPAKHLACDRLSQWAFEVDEPFPKGAVLRLTVDYVGIVHDDLSGLYINSHEEKHANKSITISAVTQFEPTFARKMLPCFDEPSFKAVFDISIIREKNHTARANMQLVRSEEYSEGLVLDQFAPSVKMSTYLLAIAVLDNFAKVRRMTRNTKRPVEINLFAPADSINGQTEFGLHTGVAALEYFEDFFDIPFPLQKTDLIALDDFAEGAMENWGLVTFRDSMLLYDADASTEKSKETVALVICHELAHQWFGNLVTMEWWNDLWLNEGFANFMEYLCVDNLFPEWNVLHNFFAENFLQSMMQDGFISSHAVSTEVEDPAQIGSIFDAISYQKGASVIQMLRGLAGNEPFRTALQEYLLKYEYDNAKGEDLWSIIQTHVTLTTSISVTDVAVAWTTQIGYPYITVTLVEDGATMLIKGQERFLFLEEERYSNASQTQWPIPVQYHSDRESRVRLTWLDPHASNVKVSLGPKANWVIANTESLGYYRVLYDSPLYTEFARQLANDHTQISTLDRGALLNDAFCFLRSGQLGAEVVFDLIQYLENGKEGERIPWVAVCGHLKAIEGLIADTELLPLYHKFERSLLLRTYEKVGWKQPTSHSLRMLQTDLLALACRLELGDCVRQAQSHFGKWLRDPSKVPVDLQPFVIEEGIRRGSIADWERVYREYRRTTIPSQRFILLIALAATEDLTLIHRFLGLCLDPTAIRPNVLPRALGVIMQNRVASLHVWRFLQMNYAKIEAQYGGTSTLLGTMVKAVVENFSTEFDLNDVLDFFRDKDLGASQARVDQAIEAIKLNIQWRRLNERPLKTWLNKWAAKKGLQ